MGNNRAPEYSWTHAQESLQKASQVRRGMGHTVEQETLAHNEIENAVGWLANLGTVLWLGEKVGYVAITASAVHSEEKTAPFTDALADALTPVFSMYARRMTQKVIQVTIPGP